MRPAIIPPTFVTTIVKLLKNKVLKFLSLMKDMDIGLLMPATLYQVISEDTIVLMFSYMDIGHKRSAILPLKIVEQKFMLKREVDIGIRPATLPVIT